MKHLGPEEKFEFRKKVGDVLIIACGALAREMVALIEMGVDGIIVSMANPDALKDAIEKGVEAAIDKSTALTTLALDEPRYVAHRDSRQSVTRHDAPIVRSISLVDDSRLSRASLATKLRTKVGQPLDRHQVAQLLELGVLQLARLEG